MRSRRRRMRGEHENTPFWPPDVRREVICSNSTPSRRCAFLELPCFIELGFFGSRVFLAWIQSVFWGGCANEIELTGKAEANSEGVCEISHRFDHWIGEKVLRRDKTRSQPSRTWNYFLSNVLLWTRVARLGTRLVFPPNFLANLIWKEKIIGGDFFSPKINTRFELGASRSKIVFPS